MMPKSNDLEKELQAATQYEAEWRKSYSNLLGNYNDLRKEYEKSFNFYRWSYMMGYVISLQIGIILGYVLKAVH